jgi:hypothetical protein
VQLQERSVAYLGHIIFAEGVAMDKQKVQAVLNWPLPCSVCVVRAFLGLTGHYYHFIHDYGAIADTLTWIL